MILFILSFIISSQKPIQLSLKIKSIINSTLNVILIISAFTFFSSSEVSFRYENYFRAKLKIRIGEEIKKLNKTRNEIIAIKILKDASPFIISNVKESYKNNLDYQSFFKFETKRILESLSVHYPERNENKTEFSDKKEKTNKVYDERELELPKIRIYNETAIENLTYKQLLENKTELSSLSVRYENIKITLQSLVMYFLMLCYSIRYMGEF